MYYSLSFKVIFQSNHKVAPYSIGIFKLQTEILFQDHYMKYRISVRKTMNMPIKKKIPTNLKNETVFSWIFQLMKLKISKGRHY